MGKRIPLDVIYWRRIGKVVQRVAKAASKPISTPNPKKAKAKKRIGRPPTGFNKREYMRLYMADKTKADKLGLKVSEWRAKFGVSRGT